MDGLSIATGVITLTAAVIQIVKHAKAMHGASKELEEVQVQFNDPCGIPLPIRSCAQC